MGTLGDLPGPERRVTVSIDAAGTVRLGDAPVRVEDLPVALRSAVEALPESGPAQPRHDLVLAIDASAPWGAAIWVVMDAVRADAYLHRVCFAVLPEQGAEEGGLVAGLPQSRGSLSPVDEVPSSVPTRVWVEATGVESQGPEIVYSVLRSAPHPVRWLALDAREEVATGYVLRILDAMYRGGVSVVELWGGWTRPRGPEDWIALFAKSRSSPAPSVRFDVPTDTVPGRMPPVARVRGLAGAKDDSWIPAHHSWSATGAFADRAPPRRQEDATDAGLDWLAAHQSSNGRWEAQGFARWCRGREAEGTAPPTGEGANDVGATGAALGAFLAHGYTNRGDHPYAKVVSKGLRWLKSAQDSEGAFGARTSDTFLRHHAMATVAMVEAYGMTESPIFKESAQKAVRLLLRAREDGSLRDPSSLAWATLAFVDAALIDDDQLGRGRVQSTFSLGREILASLADELAASDARLSAAAACLVLGALGRKEKEDERLRAVVARLRAGSPADVTDPDLWLHGTRALRYVGGEAWKAWEKGLGHEIDGRRRTGSDACGVAGSWDPIGPRASEEGRVASTGVVAATLASLRYCCYPPPTLRSRDRAAAVDGEDEAGHVGGGGEKDDR